MYLTYDDYKNMGGTLDENTFVNLEFQVEAHINYATFNRLKADKEIPIEVTRLAYYLIELIGKKTAAFSLGKDNSVSNAAITSQSNDGVSISYSGMNPSDLIKLCEKDIADNIRFYLEGVTNEAGRKLLYRGLYPGE